MNQLWQTAHFADGRALYDWLEQNGLLEQAAQSHQRRLYDWKRGGYASIQGIDRMMASIGGHISDLPDWIWLP